MSIQHVATVLDSRDERVSGTRKLVLISLANRSDAKGKCWPSQQLVADEVGISVRAVSDHLKALEADGLVKRATQHLGKGNGSRTTYTLHLGKLKVAPEEVAGAEVAHATFDSCTGSRPRVTNLQEPTITTSDEVVCARAPSEQPKKKSAPRGSARGSRIPDSWAPTPKDYAFATKHDLTTEEINREADRFRNYWRGVPGRKGVKLDWEATWRNWLIGDYGIVTKKRQRAGKSSSNEGRLGSFDRLADRLEGNATRQHAEGQAYREPEDGSVIDAEYSRLAG